MPYQFFVIGNKGISDRSSFVYLQGTMHRRSRAELERPAEGELLEASGGDRE